MNFAENTILFQTQISKLNGSFHLNDNNLLLYDIFICDINKINLLK